MRPVLGTELGQAAPGVLIILKGSQGFLSLLMGTDFLWAKGSSSTTILSSADVLVQEKRRPILPFFPKFTW